jgi:hypothetical protein
VEAAVAEQLAGGDCLVSLFVCSMVNSPWTR